MEIVRRHFPSLDSTNNWAKQNAQQLDRNCLTLVTASEQTAGRGRFSRRWISPANQNIYATFCLFVEKHRIDIGNLPQVLAMSAAKTLKDLGFETKLKWPNDVLIQGKKIAGILSETTPLSDELCVILGIGINVNMPQEILDQIDLPAISLVALDGVQRDVEEVLGLLQKNFVEALDLFLEEGFHPFLLDYRDSMAYDVGDPIRFHDNRVVRKGVFLGINEDGSLKMILDTGEMKTFHAGEIIF
jgi:BirA family transcriptional regulator, biotin operon repressor / biotin---[acetyl-CoA-carboxylase] ligase